jgi:hypothetical protein
MSFDARSRERLESLGRQLPQRLPPPVTGPASPSELVQNPRRHKVETEQDPQQLFRELMDVSPDGTVPPHLMDRLRQIEHRRDAPIQAVSAAGAATGGAAPTPNQSGVRSGRQPIRSSDREQRLKRSGSPEASALYTAFQQLLLEDDSLD